MNFNVSNIGYLLREVSVDEISTGTMGLKESVEFAYKLVCAAEEILALCDITEEADMCYEIGEELSGILIRLNLSEVGKGL